MNSLADIITSEIKRQYKSVRQFAITIGIPQTTIVSALKNGVSGTSYDTVVKMCKFLHIELVNYDTHIVMTDDVIDMVNMYNSLDEKGAHAVRAFLAMEFNRCNSSVDYIGQAAALGGEIAANKVSQTQQKSIQEALNAMKD